MAAKQPRDGGDLLRLVRSVKWPYRVNNKMAVIYPPDADEPVTVGLHGGDPHAFENSRARLRRAGLFDAVHTKATEDAATARAAVEQSRQATEARIQQINTRAAAEAARGETTVARRDQVLYDLAKRCEDVNWPVRTIGNDQSHILVSPPGRRPITIATGSSDRNYPSRVLAKLAGAGLLDAEANMGVRGEEDRQRKLKDGRNKADARAEIMASEAAAAAATAAASTPTPVAVADHPTSTRSESPPTDVPGGYDYIAGVAVAEWAYAKTPVRAIDQKCAELLLTNGDVVYGCHLGDFVGPSWQSVSRHRKAEHPDLLGRNAKQRAANAAAALAADPQPTPEPSTGHVGPVIDLAPKVAAVKAQRPTVVFKPGTAGGADAADNYNRLTQLLGSRQVYERAKATAPAPANGVAPAAPAPPINGVEVRAPRTPQEPIMPRRIDDVPPTVRAGISTVAAAKPPARTPAPPAAPVSPAPGAPMDLTAMVTKLRRLATVENERAALVQENGRLELENKAFRDQVDKARAQAAALADQCVTKDREIMRLRAKLNEDAAVVEAAKELQQLMSTLMGGAPQLAA